MTNRRTHASIGLREFFSEQWQYFTSALATKSDDKKWQKKNKQRLQQTIESVVDGTDAKVRMISGYKEKLRRCSQSQIQYVDEMIKAFEAPLSLSKTEFNKSDLLQSMFYRFHELSRILDSDKTLTQWQLQNRDHHGDIYGLLKARVTQKQVLAPTLIGDNVVNNVQQQQLVISGISLVGLVRNEDALAQQLKAYCHQQIIEQLKLQLAPILASAKGVACPLSPEDVASPEAYLSHLQQLMSEPETILSLESCQYETNRFGLLANEHIEADRRFRFNRIKLINEQSYLLLPIKFTVL
ncbi:hypothetical protein [Thalassotalea aquiviva]|uniref:hypothetical protein n=1 Tax=Thalassotalea aquiviva TaxID=3242415 RepID=UPI00352AE258